MPRYGLDLNVRSIVFVNAATEEEALTLARAHAWLRNEAVNTPRPQKRAGLSTRQSSCILFNSVVSFTLACCALKPKGVPMRGETSPFRRSLEKRAKILQRGTKESLDQSEAALANSRSLLKRFQLGAAQDRDAPCHDPRP
jgi:hypothetical protein